MANCIRTLAITALVFAVLTAQARANCTNPAATEGKLIYNLDHHVLQFCNGASWVPVGSPGPSTSTPSSCPSNFDGPDVCPAGFFPGGTGSCYRIIGNPSATWADSRTSCQALGADLVTINDAAENAFLAGEIGTDTWIGFTDAATEGSFVWVAGSSPYTSWNAGEPNEQGSEDCAVIQVGGGWNDTDCSGGLRAICEMPATGSSTCVDANPSSFSFTNGVAGASAVTTSDLQRIYGISGNVPVSISGGSAQYRICPDLACGAPTQDWTSSAGVVQNNQYIQLRLTSSGTNGATVSTTVIVGAMSRGWSVETRSCGITSGLIGYWKFNDASGSTAADSSASTVTGTLTNSPAWVAGKIGGALQTNSTGYVTMGSATALNLGSSGTLVAWVKQTSYNGYAPIVTKINWNTDTNGYALGMINDKLLVNLDNASGATEAVGATTMTLNNWHLAATTWNGTTARVYLDGVQDASMSQTITPTPSPSTFYVGAADSWGTRFDGAIDEVRVYNRALTAGEITTLYNSGLGCSE